jgi:hypothetical protein
MLQVELQNGTGVLFPRSQLRGFEASRLYAHTAVNVVLAASHSFTSMELVWPSVATPCPALGNAKERYTSRQAQTRIMRFRGNSSVA